jgi:hypothetical protein
MNDAVDPQNAHGGFKNMNAARVKSLTPESIARVYAAWAKGTDDIGDAKRTVAILQAFNPNKLQANGAAQSQGGAFLESRDRGFNVTVSAWCMSANSQGKLRELVDEILAIGREGDGVAARTMPNTMRLNESLDNLFEGDRLTELSRVKNVWDPEGLFWSPYERKKMGRL